MVKKILITKIKRVQWARVGWTLADNPQLFLVPVGFSAILFVALNEKKRIDRRMREYYERVRQWE